VALFEPDHPVNHPGTYSHWETENGFLLFPTIVSPWYSSKRNRRKTIQPVDYLILFVLLALSLTLCLLLLFLRISLFELRALSSLF